MAGAQRPDFQAAAARVSSAGGLAMQSGGITNAVRTGVGVYEVALAQLDAAQHTARVQVIRTNGDKVVPTLEWVSDTLLRVRTVRVA